MVLARVFARQFWISILVFFAVSLVSRILRSSSRKLFSVHFEYSQAAQRDRGKKKESKAEQKT